MKWLKYTLNNGNLSQKGSENRQNTQHSALSYTTGNRHSPIHSLTHTHPHSQTDTRMSRQVLASSPSMEFEKVRTSI